jgi:hypothetical protein
MRRYRSCTTRHFKFAGHGWQSGFLALQVRSLYKLDANMNIKRLLLAIVVAYAIIFGTDFLVHGVWLRLDYNATQQIWRPETEMNARMAWMLAAQVLWAITFVIIWAKGPSDSGRVACALGFGFLMGIFQQIWALIMYAVLPMPGTIAIKWFVAGVVQNMLLGLATFWVYKPLPATAPAQS